ncbi:hypothetical protein GQ457_02G037370 [Hibiscus cannabinus]
MQLQLAAVFFTFSLGTKVHYYGRTIFFGGAKYRATGRDFVVRRDKFAENYSISHFSKGLELMDSNGRRSEETDLAVVVSTSSSSSTSILPMLSSASTSSPVSEKKYDVFLSSRGEDTRNNFTDHLYDALKRNIIVAFRDDIRPEASEGIRLELFKAIRQSWCSVIVFSKSYVFSSWCLDELVEIVKQRNDEGHEIFPVFYDVDPSDLRKQKGKVEEAFVGHEEGYKGEKDRILKCRNALTQVSKIKGWHFNTNK